MGDILTIHQLVSSGTNGLSTRPAHTLNTSSFTIVSIGKILLVGGISGGRKQKRGSCRLRGRSFIDDRGARLQVEQRIKRARGGRAGESGARKSVFSKPRSTYRSTSVPYSRQEPTAHARPYLIRRPIHAHAHACSNVTESRAIFRKLRPTLTSLPYNTLSLVYPTPISRQSYGECGKGCMMTPLQQGPTTMEIPSTGPDKGAQGTRPSQHSKSPDWHASGENSPYPNSMYAPISEPELQVNTQPASYHEPATSPSTSAHPSLSEASQSSTLEYQKRLETPPSSLSNPSSQGHPPRIGQDLVQESKEHGVASVTRLESYSRSQPPPLDTNITQWPVAHNGGLGGESIHWQKRTASGDIKPSGASLPTSPVNNIRRGHAKNASISSNGSQIGEVHCPTKLQPV